MQYCIICPTRWLDKFAVQSKCHLVLAQHMNDRAYLEFYKRRLADGDTVILDNGAYEDQMPDFKTYLEAIKELKPTYCVLPDDPGDFQRSSMMSLDFNKYAGDYLHQENIGRLWVCHAEDGDLPNFINSYELGASNAHGICFSRLTKSYGTPQEMPPMRRVQFIDYLKSIKKWNPAKYHHALGMLNGSMWELRELAIRGVNSIDSSAPVWRGLMGYKITEPWPDWPLSMHPAVTATSLVDKGITAGDMLAQQNLDLVLKHCEDRNDV